MNEKPNENSGGSNVVRYERRGSGVHFNNMPAQDELIFIDENTLPCDLPPGQPAPDRTQSGDEEILYIGPE
jgi:hypothetical protein